MVSNLELIFVLPRQPANDELGMKTYHDNAINILAGWSMGFVLKLLLNMNFQHKYVCFLGKNGHFHIAGYPLCLTLLHN